MIEKVGVLALILDQNVKKWCKVVESGLK